MTAAPDPWGLAASIADVIRALGEVREELAELRHAIEAQSAGAVHYLPTADAAKLGGFPSPAALRMAARRHAEIAAARIGRRWDRARLLAAVGGKRVEQ